MSTDTSDTLWMELQNSIGMDLGGGPSVAPDEVNMPMIRHWIDAFDDRNPAYEDESLAEQTRFSGVIAPPAMLQTWTMARPKIEGIAERGGSAVEINQDSPLMKLDAAGFNATLATNSELEFVRPLRVGDQLVSQTILESVSEQKKTGLGKGYFVTWVSTYRDQHDEVVGRQTFRILKFNPLTMGDE